MRWRSLAVAYFCVQAVAVVGWWAMLAFMPATRVAFAIRGAPFAALGAFSLGDLGLVAVGSVVVGVRHGRRWAVYAAWLVSGALLYGTCYVVAAAATGLNSPLGAALMIPASLASVTASVILTRDANADPLSPGSSS